MLRSSNALSNARRKAAILLITIVMLMLFLVIGICFLVFAESQATSARIYREASLYLADRYPTPEEMLGWALGEIIYDVPDGPDDTLYDGSYSAIRGHGLARNMYGWNYVSSIPGTNVGMNNETPYNGVGKLHTAGTTAMNPYGFDDQRLINYQYYVGDGFKRNPERFEPYPSNTTTPAYVPPPGTYTGGFSVPYTYPDVNNAYLAAMNANGQVLIPSYWRGEHVNFRHPTLPPGTAALSPNNRLWTDPTQSPAYKYMTLRPRPLEQLTPTELATLPEATIRAMATLPNNQIFPLPASDTGDVRNMPGPGPMDSVWVDLGFPARRLDATGRKIKPMFAILIVDLDGRVNINLAGNVKELPGNEYHGSIQGFGPWEINPRHTMTTTNNPFPLPNQFGPLGSAGEYQDLFRGNVTAGGRFGQKLAPGPNYPPPGGFPVSPPAVPNFPVPNAANWTTAIPGNSPRNYAQVDLDASSVVANAIPPFINGTRTQVALPALGGATPGLYSAFPSFPQHYQNGNNDERYYHPSLFNPFQLNRPPTFPSTTNELDRLLPVADMQKLLAWTTPGPVASAANPFGTSPDVINSELGKLWPTNILRYPQMRGLITTHSMDFDRAGAVPGQPINGPPGFAPSPSPYVYNPLTRLPGGASGPVFNNGSPTSLLPNRNNASLTASNGDLNGIDWRSLLATLGRVDINRRLESYFINNTPPAPGTQLNLSSPAVQAQVDKANRDRRLLAQDIFDRLRYATGAADPTDPTYQFATNDPANPASPNAVYRPQFEALRYLAQLAVNIVDFVDEDDFSTAYNFVPSPTPQQWGWVFGTEIPRLVINEAYAQIQNDPGDTFGTMSTFAPGKIFDPDTPAARMADPFTGVVGGALAKAQLPYRVNFFVELHNPHNQDPALSENGAARLQLTNPPAPGKPKGVYKLIIRSQVDPNLTRDPSNVTGDPKTSGPPKIDAQVLDFESDGPAAPPGIQDVVQPSGGSYGDRAANDKLNNGYFVLGPSTKYIDSMGMPKSNWQANFPYDRDPPKMNAVPFTPTVSVKDQPFGGVNSQLWAPVPSDGSFDLTTLAANQPSVFLQRLANPMLPEDTNTSSPYYNPYITVDYLQMPPPPPSTSNWLNDAVLYDNVGARNAAGNQRQPLNGGANNRLAIGRRQPFRATAISAQSLATASTITVDNTFFTQNGDTTTNPGGNLRNTLDSYFEWLIHFDRSLASPMDLLYVSGVKPHELTQQFIPGNAQITTQFATTPTERHQHMAPWRVADTRLYRALELLGTHSYMFGTAFGGRIPGKININTIWDDEVFRALADAHNPSAGPNPNVVNYFTANDVNNLWGGPTGLKARRTPTGVPGPNDQPIWSLATPNPGGADLQYPAPAAGIGMTILDPAKDFAGTFPGIVPGGQTPHPYMREELLRKISGNITTRSNTFAVFITTGYFDVRDDTTQPVKLGAEVDIRLRHRMFAVVDRTNLSIDSLNGRTQGPRPIFFPLEPITVGPTNSHGDLTVNAQNQFVGLQTTVSVPPTAIIETMVPHYSVQGVGPNGVLTIRDTIDHNGQEFSATSGELFQIRRGTALYVDVGSRMELVVVTEVHPPIPGDLGNPKQKSTIKFQKGAGSFAPHSQGCSIGTQRIGNPGPQPLPLDYESSPYSNTVVPFRMIRQ